jgi:hypothetical protein
MSVKGGAVHPMVLDDLERGKFRFVESKESGEKISRKASFVLTKRTDEEIGGVLRPSSSQPSLSAELVEAVMYDGQYRFSSERAHEVAMWCGLVSFLVLGMGLVCVGLFMALTH